MRAAIHPAAKAAIVTGVAVYKHTMDAVMDAGSWK
jgi:hypothetical protein